MGLAETAELAVRINLTGNASAGIDKLQRKVNGLGVSSRRVGKGVGQIGAGFARAGLLVGGAAVAGLGAAAKAAIDFEDAFAGVKKTVDEADLAKAGLSFEGLARTFRDMATEIPIAATEFANLGATAGALGVAAGDIDDFVKTTALLGVTTNLSADEAADALGRIGTILKFTGKDYENFADSLVALGNAGASTESEIIEITKRFAAEGKAAGLATEDIAGLASATASLGFAPERGGTALARVFANMGTNISLANKKGKAFASITGKSITDLQKSLDKGQGMSIFLDVLKGIKGLSPTDANRTLKALGITNTSDRTIFRTMADNLPFVTEQLKIATEATGALSEEATKRFDTIRSKIQLLKNNLVEAGITIGEGFAPAIGRAAEKLSAFLKQDGNKSELKKLGEDIGKSIDDVDWQAVLDGARDFVGVMRGALSVTLRILEAINKLPTEVKAAAAGLLVLNKASGGLIGAGVGNIVGGIGETLTRSLGSMLPGVGKLFAQPVFVTNWPMGGLGGGIPGAGGAGGLLGLFPAALFATAVIAAAVPIGEAFAAALPAELKGPDGQGKSESQTRTENARAEMERNKPKPGPGERSRGTGMSDRRGDRPVSVKGRAELAAERLAEAAKRMAAAAARLQGIHVDKGRHGNLERPRPAPQGKDVVDPRDPKETPAKLEAANRRLEGIQRDAGRHHSSQLTALGDGKRETAHGASLMSSTTRSSSAQNAATISAAIARNRPIVTTIVNVSATTVTRTTQVIKRYGSTSGSRNAGSATGHGHTHQ